MAHLPGDRPLVYPSPLKKETEIDLNHSNPTIFHSSVGVCGKGSVYVEVGEGLAQVKLIAVVRGPKQQSVTRPQFEVEVSFAPFSRPVLEADDGRVLAAHTKEAVEGCVNLDAHPNSAISVVIKILQARCDFEDLLGPCITGSSIALRDADISMDDFVIAVSCKSRAGAIEGSAATNTIGISLKDQKVRYMNLRDLVKSQAEIESIIGEASNIIDVISSRIGFSA